MNGNNFVELRPRIWDTKRKPGGRKLQPRVGKQYHTKIQTLQCNCFQPLPQMVLSSLNTSETPKVKYCCKKHVVNNHCSCRNSKDTNVIKYAKTKGNKTN